MTKRELMEMIKDMDDNTEIEFVKDTQDRDGFWGQNKVTDIVGIVAKNAEPIGTFYGNNIYVKSREWKLDKDR
jgi:hypothetical protein